MRQLQWLLPLSGQRVDTPVEGQLRKLPPQERDERAKRLAAKITGFSIQGEYEPAHVILG